MSIEDSIMPHQVETIDYGLKNPYFIMALPPGLGKTLTATEIVRRLALRAKRDVTTLYICPASVKLNIKDEILKWYPHAKISCFMSKKDLYDLWDTDYAIINYEMIKEAEFLFKWADILIVDECFHPHTEVDTPMGTKRIEDIEVGDEILNCMGIDRVVGVSKKLVSDPLYIKFNNVKIICSKNHPFLTRRGWVMASDLTSEDYLVSTNKAMCVLQSTSSEDPQDSILRSVLLCEVENEAARSKGENTYSRGKRESCCKEERYKVTREFGENEEEQSYELPHSLGENERDIEKDRSSALYKRWKWDRPYNYRANYFRQFTRHILERGSNYWSKTRKWLSLQLQNRPWVSLFKVRYRNRWLFSWIEAKERTRHKEGTISNRHGVDYFKIQELGSAPEFGGSYFYDLEIERHPSFSIARTLVHNCHLAKNPEAKRSDLLHQFIFEYEIKRVMLLTGTPMANNVADFYSLIAICYYSPRFNDPEFLKKFPTYIDFAEHFCNRVEFYSDYGMKVKYEGVKNVKELKSYLKDIYISFDADKVLKIEKGITKHIQVKELDNPKILEDFQKFVTSDVGQTISSKAKKEAALAMADATIEYVNLLLKTGVDKVVVFSDHIDAALKIAQAFNTKAMTSLMTNNQDRRDLVKEFQEGEQRVIVGTSVMGTSWTLTRSNNLVVNDFPWRPGDLDQLLRRIRRVCQKRTPFYHFMHGSFQSKYILNLLEEKMEAINKVLN